MTAHRRTSTANVAHEMHNRCSSSLSFRVAVVWCKLASTNGQQIPLWPSNSSTMMQQSNKYKGIDNKAKAHCPVRGNECANKCMKQAAKEKAGPSSAGRRGSKASSSSAHQPNAQACKAGRPRGRAQQKQPGQKQPGQKQPG
ncbi:TPA: hypothetical protein ACH3X3_011671 [Trebouxia sp. C0006]